jgi:hypothetical protein
MSNDYHYDEDKNNNDDKHGVFLDRIPQIRLMVQDILLNPAPIAEQPDILKKLNILNYALGEWNDQYDRMQYKQ